MTRVATGMEELLSHPPGWLIGKARVGLLIHPASVDRDLRLVVERFAQAFPGVLKILFGPQHGLWGEKQDNMVASAHESATPWGVPGYSLYGEVLAPTPQMLEGIDVLVVDLQDVGCRVYTYTATLLGCLEACARSGVTVVVADRPNPIGGQVEGNLLSPAMASFVGPHPLPMRHGMTLGELGRLLVAERELDVRLEVIPARGWKRGMFFRETALPWVLPSPNLPTPETCRVYPGQVLLEGTNLSEGRGTTRPFEIFGAPFIDPFVLRDRLERRRLPGVRFRALFFEPTFHKWQGKRCGGLQIHVTDPGGFRPYLTTLWILHEIREEWGDRLAWREPPYEFESRRLPMDLLLGDPLVRQSLEQGRSPGEMETAWSSALKEWKERAEEYLVYGE